MSQDDKLIHFPFPISILYLSYFYSYGRGPARSTAGRCLGRNYMVYPLFCLIKGPPLS